MALAETEGGNKDTLVPEKIKYGGIYTKKPNRIPLCIPLLLKNQNIAEENSLSKLFNADTTTQLKPASLWKEVTDEPREW